MGRVTVFRGFAFGKIHKIIFSILILGVLWFGVRYFVGAVPPAPPDTTMPPAIIDFSSDLPAITVDELEKDSTTTHLSWTVVNLPATDTLSLQIYQLNQWGDVFPGEALPATDSREVIVQQPLGFEPPTYRLSILNAKKEVIEERTLTIPYDMKAMADLKPEIYSFTSTTQNIVVSSLPNQRAQVPVSWMVLNRVPNSNVTFEQMMDDGSIIPIELSRPFLWLPSTGEGMVAPINPQQVDEPVRLRMRVVNMMTGDTYASAELVLPVVGSATLPTSVPATAVPMPVSQGNPPPVQPTSSDVTAGCTISPLDVPVVGRPGDGCNVYADSTTSVRINSFTLTDEKALPPIFGARPGGDGATAHWDISGNAQVLIEVYELGPLQAGSTPSYMPNTYASLPASGSADIFMTGYPDGARVILWAYDTVGTTTATPYRRLAYSIIDVPHLISPTLDNCIPTYHFTSLDVDPHGCNVAVNRDTATAAYEPFENGFMLWFYDGIYVMRKDGSYTLYVDSQYANMPDNPVTDTPPAGRSSPINGFGKVWGNYSEVRDALGWALGPEQGYTMTTESTPIATYHYVTLPDGRVVQIHNAPVWNFEAPP